VSTSIESGHAYYAKPTIAQKLWIFLGFRKGHAPRPDEDELKDGWAPSWFCVETYIHLDWSDRLRVLISGNLHIDHAIKTDLPINKSNAVSAVGILPPGANRNG
jgi:hypothetical protein